MEINVGRGVGWGGALKVVLDTSLVIDATSAGIGINRAASGYALDVYRPATGVIARFENTVGSQVIFQDAGGGGVMTPGLSGWYVTDTIGSYLGSGNGRVTIANSNGNITTNGSVGIGLDTLLNAKLNVHGAGYQIKLSGVDIDNPGFVGVGSNEKMYLTDWLTTTKGIMIDLTNGNVSVGSLYDTGYKLQVAGGIYAVGNIHAEVEQNSAVQSVIRNNSNGSLSYSRFLLNAYGNSWSMGMGSAANNSNAFEIRDDALGADNLRMSMAVGGAISVTNNVWHKSLDGQSRFYYGSNSSNYYRANGSHIFRNGSDTDVAEISSAGTATFDGSVRAKAGYYHIDTGGTARWLTYSPGVDVSWYIRDAVNSRMQVTYSPGATSAIANTLFGSKVEVEGGQLTVSGSVNSAVSLFPTYGLGSSVLDFKAIGSTNQDARMASGVGSSSNIVFYTGGATLVERGRFVDTGLDVTGNFTASGSFSASGNVGIGSGATLSNARMSLGTAFGNQILLYDNAIGGGYGFGIQASLLQIFCNDSADSVSIGYGKSTSFTPALTTTGTNVSITGHVTSVIQSLSTDPTGSDLASGQTRTIKNTSTGTTKVWLNDGGTFKSLTFV